jgi:hypothetical protein
MAPPETIGRINTGRHFEELNLPCDQLRVLVEGIPLGGISLVLSVLRL